MYFKLIFLEMTECVFANINILQIYLCMLQLNLRKNDVFQHAITNGKYIRTRLYTRRKSTKKSFLFCKSSTLHTQLPINYKPNKYTFSFLVLLVNDNSIHSIKSIITADSTSFFIIISYKWLYNIHAFRFYNRFL